MHQTSHVGPFVLTGHRHCDAADHTKASHLAPQPTSSPSKTDPPADKATPNRCAPVTPTPRSVTSSYCPPTGEILTGTGQSPRSACRSTTAPCLLYTSPSPRDG